MVAMYQHIWGHNQQSIDHTKSSGVSNGFGKGASAILARRYEVWRALLARMELRAVR